MLNTFFDNHSHTEYSNIRMIDSINKPENLINRAIELGLSGIAITDHETLSAHIKVNKIAKKLQETNPDFTVALGNEIYLTETREKSQKYYHFILLAKDRLGYKGLCELSSVAWYNGYYTGKMFRVPTLKSELETIMKKYKGHIIATTACMGGELSTMLYGLSLARETENKEQEIYFYQKAKEFIDFCIDVFGKDDFYIECAPANKKDQIAVNKLLLGIATSYRLKMVVGTDAHYLRKEDRYVHKAYLNSKEDKEREVDAFYEFAYLQSPEEVRNNLLASFGDNDIVDWIFNNSLDIKSKITFYSLEKNQQVTEVPVTDYPKNAWKSYRNNEVFEKKEYSLLKNLFESDNIQERYWMNQCIEGLFNNGIGFNTKYLDRLVEEANTMKTVGEKLGTCIFAYPNTLQHYIDLFWRCGSTVGAGRGSACSGLNHYLEGITQLDPIEWDLPYWRFLNPERLELPSLMMMLGSCKKRMLT